LVIKSQQIKRSINSIFLLFFSIQYSDIIKSEEFQNLTNEQLIELIKDDNLVVASEETVYEAVEAWCKHDLENRLVHLDKIMEYILLNRVFLY
jgi:hypothetical protein